MLISPGTCPWCGQEIKKPNFFHGTCEHCSKPYKPIILTYNRYHTQRSETSPLIVYATLVLSFLIFLFTTILFLDAHPVIGIFSVVLTCLYGYCLVFKRPTAYLIKDESGQENAGKEEGASAGGVSIFLAFPYNLSFYHTQADIEILTPDTGIPDNFYQITLHGKDDLKEIYIETDERTPAGLLKPGIEFRLYIEGYEPLYGITLQPLNQKADIFQAQFEFSGEEARLDKSDYYRADMISAAEELFFWLIPDFHDALADIKTGKSVYEVKLLHPVHEAKELRLPIDFVLRQKDGTCLGKGTVTYLFANRCLFDVDAKVDSDNVSRDRWL